MVKFREVRITNLPILLCIVMTVWIYVKAKGKLMVDNDMEIPMGLVFDDSINRETPVQAAMRILKQLYGLRFKESQFIELDCDDTRCYIGLNLDYFPESYTDKEPIFVNIQTKELLQHPLTRQFLGLN